MSYLFYIMSISSTIKEWNNKLNELASYLDNPFSGMVIFIVLLAAATIAIRSNHKS